MKHLPNGGKYFSHLLSNIAIFQLLRRRAAHLQELKNHFDVDFVSFRLMKSLDVCVSKTNQICV